MDKELQMAHFRGVITQPQRQGILERQIVRLGEIPEFAWPGGYPIAYYPEPGVVLCGECAEEDRQEAIAECLDYILPDWDALEGNVEDHGAVQCTNCGKFLVGP